MGFYDILAVPFGYALSFLFEITNNYLLSLILITLIIRILLLPQAVIQQKNSAKQMRLQAKVNKIRAKYSTLNPREAQMKISEETQELYRREGFSMNNMGCLPMILQLVVMMGLYGAIYSPIKLVLKFSEAQIAELTAAYQQVIGEVTANRQIELLILNKFSELKEYLNEWGATFTSLNDFCEAYTDRYHNPLYWHYPYSDDKHNGLYFVLCRDGVLCLPYDQMDGEYYEYFELEDAHFLDTDSINIFIDDWIRFSVDMVDAMQAMKEWLKK